MRTGCTRQKDYPVVITVVSVRGKCSQGFQKGDSWTIESNITPGNMCMLAYSNIYPFLRTFMCGGEHIWNRRDRDRTLVMCPDIVNQVIYELKRVRPDETNSE